MTGDGVNDAPSFMQQISELRWAQMEQMWLKMRQNLILADDNFFPRLKKQWKRGAVFMSILKSRFYFYCPQTLEKL